MPVDTNSSCMDNHSEIKERAAEVTCRRGVVKNNILRSIQTTRTRRPDERSRVVSATGDAFERGGELIPRQQGLDIGDGGEIGACCGRVEIEWIRR